MPQVDKNIDEVGPQDLMTLHETLPMVREKQPVDSIDIKKVKKSLGRLGARPPKTKKRGRPRKHPLDQGLLKYDPQRMGRPLDYTPERRDQFVASYLANYCNMTAAAHETDIPLRVAIKWREEQADFKEDIELAERILADAVDLAFMDRVLDPESPKHQWILFFKERRDRRYARQAPVAGKQQVAVIIQDSTFNPQRVQIKEVSSLGALETNNAGSP